MDQIIIDVEQEEEDRRREEADMEIALRMSLEESKAQARSRTQAQANGDASSSKTSNRDLASLDEEISDVQAQISRLQSLLNTLCKQRDEKLREISVPAPSRNRGKENAGGPKIDYNSTAFEWSGGLEEKLQSVFGFESFRLCQEGICNASLDGRDIVAIMPTGGGKSLGYQLPALMVPGCTLVISPLLALIADQIMHLRELNVNAVMLTGSTSKEESNETFRCLEAMANGSSSSEIKLCYVTPEKIAKSNALKRALEKLHRVNKLARFVIDEAHCVSSEGHDFRPDYQRLSTLRQLFPKVPILALSATCPAAVLSDLISTLRMPALTLSSSANQNGTVLFSTSLYRRNLHYHVLPKPSGTNDSIKEMSRYILENHKDDTGIVYCLSKKDAESVAESLAEVSHGQIKTGVYHADIADANKERLHRQWREGRAKVVCATIAFGLGIDKGDVRFVIHHTLSKSLDGFYQESGRAGRDGKDADCVLYYRPQDANRITGLTYGEHAGQEKALAMLAFASDVEECRKIQFAKYFNKSSKLSLSSWATEEEDTLVRCGHCDNCTRPPDALEHAGPLVAWQILRVAEAAGKEVTMAQLCDLARGLGGGGGGGGTKDSGAGGRGKGKGKPKAAVDVDAVAGGKVELSREHTEAVIVRLLVSGFLELAFVPTAYNINVYLRPAGLAARFTRLARDAVGRGQGPAFDCAFVRKGKGKRRATIGAAATGGSGAKGQKAEKEKEKEKERGDMGAKGKAKGTGTPRGAGTHASSASLSASARGKRKRAASVTSSLEDEKAEGEAEEEDDEERLREEMDGFIVSDSDDEYMDEWETSLRGRGRPPPTRGPEPTLKRARRSLDGLGTSISRLASSSSRTQSSRDDVIEISDSE